MIYPLRPLLSISLFLAALWSLSTGSVLAADSPFQDYLRYTQIVNSNVDPAELGAHLLPAARAKFDAMSAEEKGKYRDGLRQMFNFQDVKLRSEAKTGNQATVIVDCKAMDSTGVGKQMAMQSFVNTITMTKYGDTWVSSNIDIKRPQEAIAAGIGNAQTMTQDKAWCAAVHTMKVPNKPLSGMLQGVPFTFERADFSSFKEHDSIGIHIADNGKFKNLTIFLGLEARPNQTTGPINYTENSGLQQVQFSGTIDGKDTSLFFDRGRGLAASMQRLPLKDGMYPIYLMMRLPDNKHSELKGYFYAKAL